MSVQAFAGKRALGCVTYLRNGYELVLQETASVKQKWSDSTPLMIVRIEWNNIGNKRHYLLQDSRGTRRWVAENDLAEAPNE